MAPDAEPDRAARPRWALFALVCLAYVMTTTGEQMLSPLFPTAAPDLGLDVDNAGIAFGLLSATIAATNLVSGWWLRRVDPGPVVRSASLAGVAGAAVTASAGNFGVLLLGQVLLGASAGLFFPAGLQLVGLTAGQARRGFAMGLYGVAFSLGLTLAAVFGAVGASIGWRAVFWIAAGMFAVTAVASSFLRLHAGHLEGRSDRVRLRHVLSLPTWVGSVLAICQYGAIPFLTTFAVDEWGISAKSAAAVLVVGRLLSIIAKVVGGASADRIGARASARRTGLALTVTGMAWVFLPASLPTYALAAVFAAMVSSLGPVANVLAVERFAHNGMALGAYRSVQIGLGALAAAAVGQVAHALGLRPTLAIAMLTPLALLWICREPVAPVAVEPAGAEEPGDAAAS